MKRKRFSEAQIIEVLQKAEAGVKKQDLCWGGRSDTFNKDRNYMTVNDGVVGKASEKRVGPQVPMNEQKPPRVKPQVNPRTQANNSNTSS